jgi:hypothetical protein
MQEYKMRSVSSESFADFEKLAKSYEMTKNDFFSIMVNHLKVTKADPRDPKPTNITDAIKAVEKRISDLDKRIISFVKTQEKELLKPTLDEIQLLAKQYAKDDLVEKIRAVNRNVTTRNNEKL